MVSLAIKQATWHQLCTDRRLTRLSWHRPRRYLSRSPKKTEELPSQKCLEAMPALRRGGCGFSVRTQAAASPARASMEDRRPVGWRRSKPARVHARVDPSGSVGGLPVIPHEPDAQPGLRHSARVCGAAGALARSVRSLSEPARRNRGAAGGAGTPGIGLTGGGVDQHHPARASQIDRPKQHPLGIAAGDRYDRLGALERPGCPQRRNSRSSVQSRHSSRSSRASPPSDAG